MRLRLRRRRGGSRARWTRPDESIRRFARVGALWGGGEELQTEKTVTLSTETLTKHKTSPRKSKSLSLSLLLFPFLLSLRQRHHSAKSPVRLLSQIAVSEGRDCSGLRGRRGGEPSRVVSSCFARLSDVLLGLSFFTHDLSLLSHFSLQ